VVTQLDVAKHAGVSFITVSRVINNKPNVNEKTKERVLKAIQELRYYPNSLGRALNMNKTNIIGVEIPLMRGVTIHETPYYSQLLTGVEKACESSGYDILVSASQKERENYNYLQNYFERKVDGLIIITPDTTDIQMKDIESQNIPCVIIGERPQNQISYIDTDNKEGATKLTEYLIKMGHTKIAFLKGWSYARNAADRLEGFYFTMQKHQLPVNPDWVYEGDFGYEVGKKIARIIHNEKEKPTAIICANDQMAIGFLAESQIIGQKIPEDISIVGYDDITISSYTTPPLTTARQPLLDMGFTAAKVLINRIGNHDLPINKEIFQVELMERKSVKKII
jgi:LacI family transcriptional regulator